MKVTQNTKKETVAMLIDVQNLGVRKLFPQAKISCDENNKTDLQVQNVVNKNNLQDTEVSTEIISSPTAATCSSKSIDIQMDPPPSLSAPTTASSPISGYQLINITISADVFILLSCPGFHNIQCLKLCDINERKRFGKTFTT